MADGFVNKILNIFGLGNEEDLTREIDNELAENKIHIISKPNMGIVPDAREIDITNIEIMKIHDFDEIKNVINQLKKRKIVIVNLKDVNVAAAQRCVDFACGAIEAVGGDIKEISHMILLLTPDDVYVSSELKNELSRQGFF
ncbi:cell division protein SepF [Oxobacter pfennigii]|uniref:Cell division protein SepF n=1 Tax=Oxobacter pfennigii TaxID=36849 RepID=A0A0N8NT69_9CLOT|nr:cell division protein SepF [Oxobacter pfennigii]KPU44000.1 cell division protein SepF [Oxobacter pfennigii]